MEDNELDPLLMRLREDLCPHLPEMFRQDVWREIRLRKAEVNEHSDSISGWIGDFLRNPTMALFAIAVAFILGIGLSLPQASSINAKTREALELGVFGRSAPGLLAILSNYAE